MSTLRAAAAEFVPSTNSKKTTQSVAQPCSDLPAAETPEEQLRQQTNEQAAGAQVDGGEEWQDESYEEGYHDEAGNWVYYDAEAWHEEHEAAAGQSDQPWQWPSQQQFDQELLNSSARTSKQAADADQEWSSLAVETDQAVGLLHAWYPTYSKPMLQQLYEACNYQLRDTLNILTEMDYEQKTPDIPGSKSSSSRPSAAYPARPAIQQPLQDWPSLATAAAGDRAHNDNSTTSSGISSWATVAKKAAATPAPPARSSNMHQRPQQQYSNNSSSSNHHTAASEAVPWVKTGAAVSQEYADARAEASDHARVRNACFHQATIAYLAGNKALAKELSAKGKEAAHRMWQAHQRASQQIFTQRNTGLSSSTASAAPAHKHQQYSPSTNGTTNVIDLHGLHVREVQTELPKQLSALAAHGQISVSIIVGVGKHTKGPPGPRLLPAVEKVLQELRLSYRQPQPGLLRVDLTGLE